MYKKGEAHFLSPLSTKHKHTRIILGGSEQVTGVYN